MNNALAITLSAISSYLLIAVFVYRYAYRNGAKDYNMTRASQREELAIDSAMIGFLWILVAIYLLGLVLFKIITPRIPETPEERNRRVEDMERETGLQ